MCLLALTATYSMHLAMRARRRVGEAVGGMSTSSCSRYPMCSDRSDLSAVQHAARKITTLMIPRALVPSQGSTDRYIACPGLLVLTQRRQRLSRARDRAVAVSTSRVMTDVSSLDHAHLEARVSSFNRLSCSTVALFGFIVHAIQKKNLTYKKY